uniref:'chromo' domain containing protein n=1 Tax=Solanum tuberosum TaxID=4113 RepID=M1DNG0_SOLTU
MQTQVTKINIQCLVDPIEYSELVESSAESLAQPRVRSGSEMVLECQSSSRCRLGMVNTRFNGIRPVAPANEPTEESAERGCGRGRGRARGRVEAEEG